MLDNSPPPSDIRALIQQLQSSGALEKLSTTELENLLSQLRGQQVTAKAMPNAQGISFQGEDGRQIVGNPDRTAKTSQAEQQSIAEILSSMKG
jgi:hypothetical protein